MAWKKDPETFGGNGGQEFENNLTFICRLSALNIWHGKFVDAIQCVWTLPDNSDVAGPKHGGAGGTHVSIQLDPDECIQLVVGRSARLVDQLQFGTSKGRILGPYGRDGGEPFGPIASLELGGFFGRAAKYVDHIGFLTRAACP